MRKDDFGEYMNNKDPDQSAKLRNLNSCHILDFYSVVCDCASS